MKTRLCPFVVLASLVALAISAAPASADSRVDVTNDRGGSDADTTYQTALTIRGSGFQVVRGGFGGVYVMFGWVRDPGGGSWRPSRGGLTGEDYRYIPDAENAADNKGYLRFVAFPGSSTAGEANAVLSRSGGFTVDLTIPGPVFQSVDRNGQVAEVDCREVTCGVITIGAHGVKNAANETFTPIRFGDVYGSEPPPADETTAPAAPAAPTAPSESADTSSDQPPGGAGADTGANPTGPAKRPAPGTPAGLVVDRTTSIAGHAMTFSARGFTPGEQVVAVLDDGVAALGPMLAGADGEVAGVLQLPADLPVGTHELRLKGAASGVEMTQRFPVAGPADAVEPAAEDTSSDPAVSAETLFLAISALVLLIAAVGFVVTTRRRRRRRRASPTALPGVVA